MDSGFGENLVQLDTSADQPVTQQVSLRPRSKYIYIDT